VLNHLAFKPPALHWKLTLESNISALKHYTSKLSSFDDLSSLHTFGFRGEALSSLCALADFHITTAQANQVPRANRLDFEISGKLRKTQIVAGQKGTTASVEGIFKRLPVRRRELEKNIKREYGKVLNLLHAYACISAGVKFSVRNTVGKTKNVVVFSTNGNRTTKENIANVYGAKTLSALIPLDLELEFEPSTPMRRSGGGGGGGDGQSNQLVVKGHISRPVFGEGRQTPDRQMFFVNSRPCGLPQIAKAFNEVYKSFNVSQSPFIFADFQMDTSAYDVNVSPDKRTILLHDAAALIESLKTSLVQLFEAADQTVPQSQVLGSKTSTMAKQQALGSLPGFVTARQVIQGTPGPAVTPDRGQGVDDSEKESEASQRTAQNSIKRFMSNRGKSDEVDTLSTPIKSTPKSQQTPMPSLVEPSSTAPDDENDDRSEQPLELEMDEETPLSPPRPSSPPAEADSSLSQQPDKSEEMPNVVQNAFDRMRPRRMPAEMATITIGEHTVTSMIGSGRLRKRASDVGFSSHGQTKKKRRIHTPSRPNMFGVQMKAFAAPGTQMDEDEGEEEEQGSEDDASETNEDVYIDEEAEEAPAEEKEEEAYASEPEDTEYVPEGNRESPDEEAEVDQQPIEKAPTAETDENALDEAEKKTQEEAMVQQLIHQAEEKAVLPSEHNTSRANKMNKGAAHRDATVQLVTTIDPSVSKLQTQMAKLRESLQSQTVSSRKADTDLDDEKTAEDRLSLTVSKADFAQMRIIGQFNLGFIIAVRPGEDHDELFIIDQHASDEKFNFERLQAETVVQNQRLVRPQRLDLTAVEEEIVLENRSALEKNGFIVTIDESGDEPIGRRCQLVSLPLSKEVVFGSRDLEELIVLLSEASGVNGISVPRPSKVRKMFAMRACRSSIMIGKTLTTRQMQRVVRNMGMIDKPWNCPHGRPTMRHLMSLGQWEEWDEYENEYTGGEEEEEGRQSSGGLDVWRRYAEEAEKEEDEDEDEEE
jgi:DNA mismatch repair protein PMS2